MMHEYVTNEWLNTWQDGYIPPSELSKLPSETSKFQFPKNMVFLLEDLIEQDEKCKQPLLRLLLADLCEKFQDYESAKHLLNQLQIQISPAKNNELDVLIRQISESHMEVIEQQKIFFDETDVKIRTKPEQLDNYQQKKPISKTPEVMCMLKQLNGLKFTEFYERYASINSTVLERTFLLDEKIVDKLVKFGFTASTIDKIPRNSKMQDRDHSVQHLVEMNYALLHASNWVKNDLAEFDKTLIQDVHCFVMKGDRFDTRGDEFMLKPIRKWRCKTVFIANEVVFPHFQAVPELMIIFINQVNPNCCVDELFVMAAFIHNSFIEIHPFVDGNGRTSRIIASLPLLIAGLPPICIRSCNKHTYFDAIAKTRMEKDLSILANFLAEEMLASLQKTEENVGKQTTKGTKRAAQDDCKSCPKKVKDQNNESFSKEKIRELTKFGNKRF